MRLCLVCMGKGSVTVGTGPVWSKATEERTCSACDGAGAIVEAKAEPEEAA